MLCRAVDNFPNDPAILFNLAEIEKRQDPAKALRLLKRANELDLSNPLARDFINNFDN